MKTTASQGLICDFHPMTPKLFHGSPWVNLQVLLCVYLLQFSVAHEAKTGASRRKSRKSMAVEFLFSFMVMLYYGDFDFK